MFISNKYLKTYLNLIQKRNSFPCKEELAEIHHIIPKSLGGSNSKKNLVVLSAREHYIAHKLLTKCTYGKDREKMINAFWGMNNRCINNSKYGFISSRSYESARKLFVEIAGSTTRGKTYEEIHGIEKAKELKALRGANVSKHRKGKSWEQIFGKEKADILRQKVSDGAAKRVGRKLTDEQKLKISLSSKGKKYPKKICPVCNTSIPSNNFKRHLFRHQQSSAPEERPQQ
jgi:hypothetical protein